MLKARISDIDSFGARWTRSNAREGPDSHQTTWLRLHCSSVRVRFCYRPTQCTVRYVQYLRYMQTLPSLRTSHTRGRSGYYIAVSRHSRKKLRCGCHPLSAVATCTPFWLTNLSRRVVTFFRELMTTIVRPVRASYDASLPCRRTYECCPPY